MKALYTSTLVIIIFIGLLFTGGMAVGIHYMHNQSVEYLNLDTDTGIDDE